MSDCEGRSAAEILEATKGLYVKTEMLRQRRVEPGQPRIFESVEESRPMTLDEQMPIMPCIPSPHSAFRSPNEPPPRPPKSERIKQRVHRLRCQATRSPPPLLRMDSEDVTDAVPDVLLPPVPKPRLSKLQSTGDISDCEDRPEPKPRRSLSSAGVMPQHINNQEFALFIQKHAKVTGPTSPVHSVAALKRRNQMHRPATPITSEVSTSTMIMDEDEKRYLEAAVKNTYSPGEPAEEFEETGSTDRYSGLLLLPRKNLSLASPTTDSGLIQSDDEEKKIPQNGSRSDDDGFFDVSHCKVRDEDESEKLTSISNQKVNEVFTAQTEDRGRGPSDLEKKARVMRWIHACDV